VYVTRPQLGAAHKFAPPETRPQLLVEAYGSGTIEGNGTAVKIITMPRSPVHPGGPPDQ